MLLSYRMCNQESRDHCIDLRQECAVKVAYLNFMPGCNYSSFLFFYCFLNLKNLGHTERPNRRFLGVTASFLRSGHPFVDARWCLTLQTRQ